MTTTKKLAEKRVARVRDYKTVFSSLAGKRVLKDLMQVHHMLSPTFVRGDDALSRLHEGERNVVLRVLMILKTDPEELQNLIEEIHTNAE